MNDHNTELVVAHTSSGSEVLAKRLPKARIVSAFNTVRVKCYLVFFEARRKNEPTQLVYCGDDPGSKVLAAELIGEVGFNPSTLDPTNRAIHRTVWAPCWSAGVRGKRTARAGLPLRAVRGNR